MAIPSKVFEYLRYPAWLLALARTSSATAQVLRGSGADVVAPDDVRALEGVLKARYREHVAGGQPDPIAARKEHLSRRAQAARMFDAIEATLAEPRMR